jgi:hypothetical protein
MSGNFQYTFGLGHVGSYQASAKPYLTSSLTVPCSSADPLEIEFPNVSRFVIVTNTSDASDPSRPIRFGFSENGVKGSVDNNYVILNNGETFEAEFRVIKVFLLSDGTYEGSGSIVAGMTGIEKTHLLNNWSGSVGVG